MLIERRNTPNYPRGSNFFDDHFQASSVSLACRQRDSLEPYAEVGGGECLDISDLASSNIKIQNWLVAGGPLDRVPFAGVSRGKFPS